MTDAESQVRTPNRDCGSLTPAWMAVNNKLSFAPGQPDVYSDKVRMRDLKGLFSGPVLTCLNLTPSYVHNLCQSRVEKGKTL